MTEKSRNQTIAELLKENKTPLLTFELQAAKDALARHRRDTYDTVPARVIAQDAHISTAIAQVVLDAPNDVKEYEFDSSGEAVTIGSIVTLRIGSSQNPEQYLVTGGTRELTDEVRASKGLSPDIEPVPLISPLGQAIFDKKSGDKTAVLINGRSLPVEIIAIQ